MMWNGTSSMIIIQKCWQGQVTQVSEDLITWIVEHL